MSAVARVPGWHVPCRRPTTYLAAIAAVLVFHLGTAANPGKNLPGAKDYDTGVALLAKGEYEKAIMPLWQATQASHPDGLMQMRQAYVALGREWSMWHELAKLHMRDITSGTEVSNSAVTPETIRERVHLFYANAIDTGAPTSVVKEYEQAKIMLGRDGTVVLSKAPEGGDQLQELIREIQKARGLDARLWHELGTILFNARAWGKSLVAMSKALDLLPGHAQIRSQVMYLRAKTLSWGGVDEDQLFAEVKDIGNPPSDALVATNQLAKVPASIAGAANWSTIWLHDLAEMMNSVSMDLDFCDKEVARGEPARLPPLHPLMALFFPPPVTPEFRLRVARTQARALLADARTSTRFRPKVYKHASVAREWYRYKTSLGAASPRVKVGFLASRFHGAALALLLVGVMPALDKEKLEVTMYSSKECDDECKQDPWRQAFISKVEHFVDLGGLKAAAAVERVRADQNHVLVDMCGYNNEGNRFTEVFALRSAPVQMHVEDYMGTQGADFIDWLWADDVVLPPRLATSGRHVSERVVYVQPSFFVSSHRELYDGVSQEQPPKSQQKKGPKRYWTHLQPEQVTCASTPRKAMSKIERRLRAKHALPISPLEDEVAGDAPSHTQEATPYRPFIFACFNKMEKIVPETLASWMRILVATRHVHGGSILWLLRFPSEAEFGLRSIAEAEVQHLLLQEPGMREDFKGAKRIAQALVRDRIIFGDFYPTDAENIARLVLADIILDTQPYGAHTGAVDALWSGVPIVTRTDIDAMAARVALSLLTGLSQMHGPLGDEVPDLVSDLAAGSAAEYEAIAIAHAANRSLHAHVRAKLKSRRKTARVFNATEHATSLGHAVIAVWGEYLDSGAQPLSKRPRTMYAYGPAADERAARVFRPAAHRLSKPSRTSTIEALAGAPPQAAKHTEL